MRKPSVTIRVPASTSNLGPGFDTLGIALKLYNQVSLRETDDGIVERIDVAGRTPAALMMTQEAVAAFFARSKKPAHGVRVEVKGDVPSGSGLGSSVTVRLGVLCGLNELHGRPLGNHAVLETVSELEGHSDNAAPALLGGFVASGIFDGSVRYRRFSVPATLKFVCCFPQYEVATDKARALLPRQVALADAVANLARVSLLTAVFATCEYEMLRGLFADRLHQPHRQKLVPQLQEVITRGEEAGALGGWLSGSGSAVICVALQRERAVAEAMNAVFARDGVRCATHVLVADNDGVRVKRG